jgi:hypothetical protein
MDANSHVPVMSEVVSISLENVLIKLKYKIKHSHYNPMGPEGSAYGAQRVLPMGPRGFCLWGPEGSAYGAQRVLPMWPRGFCLWGPEGSVYGAQRVLSMGPRGFCHGKNPQGHHRR